MTRIHIVALPHTLLTKDYIWCAYSAKVWRLVDMLLMAGHTPIVYGPDIHTDVDAGAEYVPIVDAGDRRAWFGDDVDLLTGEWDTSRVFGHWDASHISWQSMNIRAATAIRERWAPGDIVGIIAGQCQAQILDLLGEVSPLAVEWGIGYSGVLENSHKVFESYAWMHYLAGYRHQDDIRYFDTVIPNCFDPTDFVFDAGGGNFLLYMGRPNPRKGLAVIEEMAKRTSVPILIAGQPGPEIPGTTYVGLVTGRAKAQLLAGARAVLTPTSYLEPFGGVAVESMMSGTPVIASDYGAFTETVVNGVTGYRCRMLSEFMDAVEAVTSLDRHRVREVATARYSIEVGSGLYGDYLTRVASLYADGWYTGTTPADI